MDNLISKGTFLISNPYITDDNFYKTVVLICEYNECGAFGLILNKPMEVLADQVITDSNDILGSGKKLYFGGPVDTNRIFCLHGNYNNSDHKCEEICKNVFMGSSKECFKSMQEQGRTEDSFRRIYLGCSCWGDGQLEGELDMNLWTVGPANDKLVFYPDPSVIWWNVSHFASGPDIINPNLN